MYFPCIYVKLTIILMIYNTLPWTAIRVTKIIKMFTATQFMTRGLVSKETVALRRWGSEKQNFGFIMVN